MEEKIRDILSKNVTEASGCTEPAAIAYAAALAAQKVGEIKKITAYLSANVIKNAHIVCLPGAGGRSGIPMALSLGALFGDADKKLSVIAGISKENIMRAEGFSRSGAVSVFLEKGNLPLNIRVLVEDALGRAAEVTIAGSHTNITRIIEDGKIVFESTVEVDETAAKIETCGQTVAQAQDGSTAVNLKKNNGCGLSIEEVFNYSNSTTDFSLSNRIIGLSSAISDEGLNFDYGLGLGRACKNRGTGKEDRLLENIGYILCKTTAGVDARMAGADFPVMTNAGSGNQGLIASLPVIAAAELLGADAEQKNRAVLLSNLTAIVIKSKNKTLSAYCGAVTAASGVAAGMVYLCGGGAAEVKMALQNLLGNSFGMLCDGAKGTCSLKVANCTFSAVYSAYLAMKSVYPRLREGLVLDCIESTIDNLARFSELTSDKLDEAIIDFMLDKQNDTI